MPRSRSDACWRPCAFGAQSRHPAPALELGLLRVREVAVANAATVIFAVAFFAKLLCDVLFLTNVWGLSIFEAGLAMSPSPLVTALTAGLAARLADRYGQRLVAVAGALVYATGSACYALTLPAEPAFVTHFLPVSFLSGIGIAAALPTLTAAAITSLPERRFGAAAGANATARQLGGVLGVAILVAIVGDATGPGAVGDFHAGWAFIAVAAVLAAVAASRLALRRPAWSGVELCRPALGGFALEIDLRGDDLGLLTLAALVRGLLLVRRICGLPGRWPIGHELLPAATGVA